MTNKQEEQKRLVTLSELKQHSSDGDLWIQIDGKVYDTSKFKHPGGKRVLQNFANGKDASKAFEDQAHSKRAYEILPSLYVGDFQPSKDDVYPEQIVEAEYSFAMRFLVAILYLILISSLFLGLTNFEVVKQARQLLI